jgi:hypothetical protein
LPARVREVKVDALEYYSVASITHR